MNTQNDVTRLRINSKHYGLSKGINVLGRCKAAHICLKHALISKQQAIIIIADGTQYVSDMGSANGTKVDGLILEPYQLHSLKDASVISFPGNINAIFEVSQENDGATVHQETQGMDDNFYAALTQINDTINMSQNFQNFDGPTSTQVRQNSTRINTPGSIFKQFSKDAVVCTPTSASTQLLVPPDTVNPQRDRIISNNGQCTPSSAPTQVAVGCTPSSGPTQFARECTPSSAPTQFAVECTPSSAPTQFAVECTPSSAPTQFAVECTPSSAPTQFAVECTPSSAPTQVAVECTPTSAPTQRLKLPYAEKNTSKVPVNNTSGAAFKQFTKDAVECTPTSAPTQLLIPPNIVNPLRSRDISSNGQCTPSLVPTQVAIEATPSSAPTQDAGACTPSLAPTQPFKHPDAVSSRRDSVSSSDTDPMDMAAVNETVAEINRNQDKDFGDISIHDLPTQPFFSNKNEEDCSAEVSVHDMETQLFLPVESTEESQLATHLLKRKNRRLLNSDSEEQGSSDSDRQSQLHVSQLQKTSSGRLLTQSMGSPLPFIDIGEKIIERKTSTLVEAADMPEEQDSSDSDRQSQLHVSQLQKTSSGRLHSPSIDTFTERKESTIVETADMPNDDDITHQHSLRTNSSHVPDVNLADDQLSDAGSEILGAFTDVQDPEAEINTNIDLPKSMEVNEAVGSDADTDVDDGEIPATPSPRSSFVRKEIAIAYSSFSESDFDESHVKNKSLVDCSILEIPATQQDDVNTSVQGVDTQNRGIECCDDEPSMEFSLRLKSLSDEVESGDEELNKGVDKIDTLKNMDGNTSKAPFEKIENGCVNAEKIYDNKKFTDLAASMQNISSALSDTDEDSIDFAGPSKKVCHIAPTQKPEEKGFEFSAATQKNYQTSVEEQDSEDENSIDFAAPTQKMSLFEDKDESFDFLAPTQKMSLSEDRNECFDFLAPTQKIISTKKKRKENYEGSFDFDAPTQKMDHLPAEDDNEDFFLAPTQQVEQKLCGSEVEDSFDFAAPTQKVTQQTAGVEGMFDEPTQVVAIQADMLCKFAVPSWKGKATASVLEEDDEFDFSAPTQKVFQDSKMTSQTSSKETLEQDADFNFSLPTQKVHIDVPTTSKAPLDEESQLEVQFDTQTLHLTSTESRPSNPLAQTFAEESQKLLKRKSDERSESGSPKKQGRTTKSEKKDVIIKISIHQNETCGKEFTNESETMKRRGRKSRECTSTQTKNNNEALSLHRKLEEINNPETIAKLEMCGISKSDRKSKKISDLETDLRDKEQKEDVRTTKGYSVESKGERKAAEPTSSAASSKRNRKPRAVSVLHTVAENNDDIKERNAKTSSRSRGKKTISLNENSETHTSNQSFLKETFERIIDADNEGIQKESDNNNVNKVRIVGARTRKGSTNESKAIPSGKREIKASCNEPDTTKHAEKSLMICELETVGDKESNIRENKSETSMHCRNDSKFFAKNACKKSESIILEQINEPVTDVENNGFVRINEPKIYGREDRRDKNITHQEKKYANNAESSKLSSGSSKIRNNEPAKTALPRISSRRTSRSTAVKDEHEKEKKSMDNIKEEDIEIYPKILQNREGNIGINEADVENDEFVKKNEPKTYGRRGKKDKNITEQEKKNANNIESSKSSTCFSKNRSNEPAEEALPRISSRRASRNTAIKDEHEKERKAMDNIKEDASETYPKASQKRGKNIGIHEANISDLVKGKLNNEQPSPSGDIGSKRSSRGVNKKLEQDFVLNSKRKRHASSPEKVIKQKVQKRTGRPPKSIVIEEEDDSGSDFDDLLNTKKVEISVPSLINTSTTSGAKAEINQSTSREFNTSNIKDKRRNLQVKVVFTMLDSPDLRETVQNLGGKLVDSVNDCTVLVTKQVLRTEKLLVAIGQGKPICGAEWLYESKKANKFLDPWDHLIVDKEAEKKWSFSLEESLNRSLNSKIFNGCKFQVKTETAADVLKNAIVNNGGKVIVRLPKAEFCYIVASPGQKVESKKNMRVLAPEAIFDSVLRQLHHKDLQIEK